VESGHCELVEDADLVMSWLGLHRQSRQEVLEAIERVYPEKPVIVQGRRPAFDKWPMPVPAMSLLDSIEEALAKSVAETSDDVGAEAHTAVS